ncbi:MAG: ATP-dependent DNA ligase, partial [Myxococcales bacterium]|nr:ATP-dependent DNA ligase [Myxococcales bacterium]
AVQIQLFRPVLPMLASPAEDASAALEHLGSAWLEWKLDGARVQVHKRGDEVRVYSRLLNEVTLALPEVVELVRGIDARELILDGETIALRKDKSPLPFQVTMKRFGRKAVDPKLVETLPLSSFYFDCLYADGSLLDAPTTERLRALGALVPKASRVPSIQTKDAKHAAEFLRSALEAGHEGVMAKSLDASYEAGRRGQSWLKLKQAHTLDLLVLAAEWGSGRRKGWLSNLHLGAIDPGSGQPVMLGKTFKGLSDQLLKWQTEALLSREIERDGHTVYVRPELVVEIAFSDVQASPQYPAGLALRFARVKRYRDDKSPNEADTLDRVRALAPDI